MTLILSKTLLSPDLKQDLETHEKMLKRAIKLNVGDLLRYKKRLLNVYFKKNEWETEKADKLRADIQEMEKNKER